MNDKIEKAYTEIFALCKGKKWRMSIPVNEEKDSDCIIIDGIKSVEQERDTLDLKNRSMLSELRKWNDWPKEYDVLEELRLQSNQNSLCAKQAYINGLEFELKHTQVELSETYRALELALPLLQEDVCESDTNLDICNYCHQEIIIGDEHKEDCRQFVAYLVVRSCLEQKINNKTR